MHPNVFNTSRKLIGCRWGDYDSIIYKKGLLSLKGDLGMLIDPEENLDCIMTLIKQSYDINS